MSLWSDFVEFTVTETTDAVDGLNALPAAIVQIRSIRTEFHNEQIVTDSDQSPEYESQQTMRSSHQDTTVLGTMQTTVNAHTPGDLPSINVVKALTGHTTKVEDADIDDALSWWTLNQNGVI